MKRLETTRGQFLLHAVLACLVLPLALPTDGAAAEPDEIAGLVAWYRADAVGSSLSNGEDIVLWEDRSGNEHHMTAATGLPPQYFESQVNGRPSVYVNKGSMSLAKPFSLQDHTILIVYRAEGAPQKALFHGSTNRFGVLLRDGEHALDVYQHGESKAGTVFAYGTPTPPATDYRVSVLARGDGKLRSWLNGKDVSSNVEFSETIQVNTFFLLRRTTYVERLGNGLRIAEMLFYDRFLTDPERGAVTRYLSTKYGIEAASNVAAEPPDQGGTVYVSLAQLSTSTELNLNQDLVAIPWDMQDEIDPPFGHDVEKDNTRLTCLQNGTRVRLDVSLPLKGSAPLASVRVLFRVNGGPFLRGGASSGQMAKVNGEYRGTVRAEVVARLDEGDYVEVVTMREGSEGTVTVEPGAAVFIAEWK